MLGTLLTAEVGFILHESSVVIYIFKVIINKHTVIIWKEVFLAHVPLAVEYTRYTLHSFFLVSWQLSKEPFPNWASICAGS